MTVEVHAFRASELGNSSYLLLDRGSSSGLVIDPVRDTAGYIERAQASGAEIVWALETHVHNDFVSGSRELVARGARLGASARAGLAYPYEPLVDRDEIAVGAARLRVLATPGHTPEHVAYLLLDEAGEPVALFSGGALMVGTAARTDLFGPALSWRFTHDLRQSLREKILPLPDSVVVYPTHGGGSFCAVGAGAATSTTVGAERVGNPLALAGSARQFASRALTLGTYPSYYNRMRALNQAGAPLRGGGVSRPPRLSLIELDEWLAQGALLVDVRPAESFRAGHVPASLAIGADENLSAWVGWLTGPERALALLAEDGEQGEAQVTEAVRQLSRIGYDRVVGYLDGGLVTWTAAGRRLVAYDTTTMAELSKRLEAGEAVCVVDVREAAEWHAGHVPGSVNIPVHDVAAAAPELPRGVALTVHCGHGYRGTLGASLLERAGYHDLSVAADGYEAWVALEGTDRPVTGSVER